LAVAPLAVGQQDHGAECGGGAGVLVDDGLQSGEVLGLVECRAGGFHPAFFDAAVDHQRGRADGEEDGEDDEILLVAVEKFFEGIGALGDFGKRHGRFWEIGRHDRDGAEVREADQSGGGVEINAELSK
jgi:hypothetical protein